MDYVAIDFEASCLPRHGRSYPIEVGLCGPEGPVSWLIRPHGDWHGWDWTAEAEAIHGIGRDRIARDGLPAAVVLDRLIDRIDGRPVVADSALDGAWWDILAQAAGRPGPSPVTTAATLFDRLGTTTEHILAAQRHADRQCAARHRAADDALWLWTVLDRLEALTPSASDPLLRRDAPSSPGRASSSKRPVSSDRPGFSDWPSSSEWIAGLAA
ncbi:hypothetical protein LWE61_02360 [Sphingobium sufflavum]|uniref:hypothetical protein n=1 Tax=Sphingobium sufflavum TaxID=1129547 RepID=UPI001F357592|nr:hypothetical protein [Sphingobium sufflavum]MCE7795395.1 hypothetical protein [Sphingobium sufflavum]